MYDRWRGRREEEEEKERREDGPNLNADSEEQQVLPVDESGWQKGKEGHWRGNSRAITVVVLLYGAHYYGALLLLLLRLHSPGLVGP